VELKEASALPGFFDSEQELQTCRSGNCKLAGMAGIANLLNLRET